MPIARTVESRLERHRLPYTVISHPHAISSRATSAAAAVPAHQIAKSVLLADEQGYLMAVVPGDRHVDVDDLSRLLGRRLRLVEESTFAHLFTDCEFGVAPPLGPAYGIDTVIDDSMLDEKQVCFVAGDRDELVCVDRDAFLLLLGDARRVRIGGGRSDTSKESNMHSETMEVFSHTMELTGRWLSDVMGETRWDARRAYSALRAVLHVLRDRLTVAEAVDLGAQLPMLVRGLYYEGWRPSAPPLKYRHKEEFLQHIADLYPGLSAENREAAARAVFKVLARHVTAGEIQQVIDQLPADVRALWTTTP